MPALVAFLLLLADMPGLDAEPPLLPSGMDLLYSDHVAFAPSGEPIVTIGLETGQKDITFVGSEPVQVDLYEHGVLKTATVQPGQPIVVAVRRAEPAKRRFYVDMDGVPFGNEGKLE